MSELTPRQWELWRLIEHNSLVEHRKTTQKEICEKIDGYEWSNEPYVHDHCSKIWRDIKANNESLEHDKVIISKNFEYWMGSQRETEEFLNTLWKSLVPRLKRYWRYLYKAKLDGQGKLISNQGNVIDEDSYAKRFHEAYNDFDIELQKEINNQE